MSTDHLERLRAEVLALPEPERAELAHELVQSLDAPVGGVEGAWNQEILHRISEIKTRQPIWLDRKTFRKKLQAHTRAQQARLGVQ